MQDETKRVILKRIFQADIKRLWKAFTTVEDMLKWHSPAGMINPHAEVDLRVGGTYAITMEYIDTTDQVTVRGVYKEILEPTRLVYTWKWDGQDEETEVTVEFTPLSEEETEVTLTHAGFTSQPTDEAIAKNWTHEGHRNGWTTAFEKLDELVKM